MIATDSKIKIDIVPIDEIELLIPIGQEFINEADDKFFILKPIEFVKNWKKLYEANMGAIISIKVENKVVGALGFMVYPDLLSSELIAAETFWFVKKEFRGIGLKLLDKYEEIVKNLGVKRISMAHLKKLNPEKLKSIYKGRGYREMETFFVKEFE